MSQYEYENEGFMRPWGRGGYRRRWGHRRYGYGHRQPPWMGGGGGGGGEEDDDQQELELNEVQEMELASELLEITNEQELEEFLGGIVKAAGNFLGSGTGKALSGVLRDVAKTALPVVGGALGSFVAPGIGTAIGSQLGSMASSLFEMGYETEMENEQFEAAKQVVQLATKAAQIAQAAPPNMPPQVIAEHAVAEAAKDLGIQPQAAQPMAHDHSNGAGGYGYGQQQPQPQHHQHHHHRHHRHHQFAHSGGGGQTGTWERHGDRLVIYGA